MVIKAVVFDLDETLYDQTQIRDSARVQAVRAMIEKGLNCSVEEGVRVLERYQEKKAPERFKELVSFFGGNEEILWAGVDKYINSDFERLVPYEGVVEVLEFLKSKNVRLIVVSQGSSVQQEKKLDALGIKNYFDDLFLPEIGKKEEVFLGLVESLKMSGINEDEILSVGDDIKNEIKISNKLGMKTMRLCRGHYSDLVAWDDLEKADYEVRDFSEVLDVLKKDVNGGFLGGVNEMSLEKGNGELEKKNEVEKKNGLKVVAIGGGTGTSALLEGLKKYTDNITTIVTVTDTGRSTGMLRRELDIPAPGDTRNCLLALANSEKRLYDLFQYRFEEGALEGYSFGNLFLAALTKLNNGSFEKAIEEASRILSLKGSVLPATFDNVHICAELEDGNILEEEDKIIDRYNYYVYLRPKIKRVFHKPVAQVNQKAIQKIEEADLIVFSPGSLFTSIISNLLVPGISEAISKSRAKKVYVCNIMTQVSQTYGFKASDHVRKLLEYLGDGSRLDFVLLNSGRPSFELLESYKKENGFLVENDVSALESLGIKVILDDFLDDVSEKKLLWEKKDLLRHNPDMVANVLIGLV